MEQRVTDLRDRYASLRSASQPTIAGRAPAVGGDVDLQRELQLMDAEIEIANAQLDLDSAADRDAFDAAVARQIEAYRGLAAVQSVSVHAVRARGLVESLRTGVNTANARLQRYRNLSAQISDSLRAGVLVALDDLNHAEMELRDASRTREEGESRWR